MGGERIKRSTEESANIHLWAGMGLTVTSKEIGRVETHLDSLDNELSGRLRESVRTKTSVEPNTLENQHYASNEKEKHTVHHALLVSSCLNSRDKKTAIRILNTHR